MSTRNIIAGLVAVAVLVFAGYFFVSKKGKKIQAGSSIYKFSALDSKVAARVQFLKSFNGQTQWDILFEDILDEHYKSLNAKKQELLFLAVYEQLIAPNGKSAKSISLQMEGPKRELSVICNQFGVNCSLASVITFVPQQKEFLMIDGQAFTLSQVELKTVPLLAVKTEILNYLLRKIEDTLRNKMMYFAAKDVNLSAQDFVTQKVISEADLRARTDAEMSRLLPDANKATKAQLIDGFKEQIKNEATSTYLRQNYIKLPIVVNVEQPQNDFKTRWEWTPYFGAEPGDSTDVVLFANMFSDASRTDIRSFMRYQGESSAATFGWRPYFSKNDQLEWVAAELSLCVWVKQKDLFWKYMERALSAKRNAVEQDLYDAVKKSGGDSEVTKKCLVSREMKKVVEYHLQSAEYLKIINPPVTFVGNEVHVGPLSRADFEKMLSRQPR